MSFSPRLRIHNLGPIEDCDILLNRMMVLDGPQAAGKSTIAKAIFFFRTVKDELYKSFLVGWADPVPELNARWYLLRKLNRILGNYMSIKRGTYLSYEYAPLQSLVHWKNIVTLITEIRIKMIFGGNYKNCLLIIAR